MRPIPYCLHSLSVLVAISVHKLNGAGVQVCAAKPQYNTNAVQQTYRSADEARKLLLKFGINEKGADAF